LKSVLTLRAKDEQGLAVLQMVEALEGVDAAERNPLSGVTVMAGVGDPGEQPSEVTAHGGIA
jgi:hypothetical protein